MGKIMRFASEAYAKGILNDCRIYDIALTDEQLEELLLN